jgi:hypothetical protein
MVMTSLLTTLAIVTTAAVGSIVEALARWVSRARPDLRVD